MAGSSFGTFFKITTFGESHGAALGVVVDGCPSGIPLNEAIIQKELDRRRPGHHDGQFNASVTARKEADACQILSGVFEGRTTGTPIAILIPNTSQHSKDYDALKDTFRPGHADYTYTQTYGIRDHRGGRRSSARETAATIIEEITNTLKDGMVIPVSVGVSGGTRQDYLYDKLDLLIAAIPDAGYDIVSVGQLLHK